MNNLTASASRRRAVTGAGRIATGTMATEQVDVVEYDEVDVDDVKSGDEPPHPVHAPVADDEVLAEDPLTATYRPVVNHNTKVSGRDCKCCCT